MAPVISPAKLWVAKCGTRLVPDGHPEAQVLFSVKGQKVQAVHLDNFSNGGEVFGIAESAQTDDQGDGKKRAKGK